jgi:DNA modification methylase
MATLYNGDLLEVLPMLPKAEAVIVDPPYGIGESSKKNATRGKPFGSRADSKNTRGTYVPPTDYGEYAWDDEPLDAERFRAVMDAGERKIIWGGNYYELPKATKWLVWDKQNSGDFADFEMAWTNLPGAARMFRHMWNGMLRASEKGKRFHPTQKPVALMRWCLQQAGNPASVVDPCMGSAPIGVACSEVQVPYFGIEADPRYFDTACQRIENAQRQERLFA